MLPPGARSAARSRACWSRTKCRESYRCCRRLARQRKPALREGLQPGGQQMGQPGLAQGSGCLPGQHSNLDPSSLLLYYATGFITLQVFYEDHFVSLAAVHQLVSEVFCQQHSESARPDAHFVPQCHVPDGIVGSADGRMGQRVHGKTFAWVADVINDGARSADIAQGDALLRVEVATMLDSVDE